MRGDWACAWFPDLERVESASERWLLWQRAYSPVIRSPRYFALAVAVQIIGQIGITVPLSRFARSRGFTGPWLEWGLGIGVALIACLAIIWLIRRRVIHHIRRELNERRLPTCMACGYDLTGNTTGRCSECGRPILDTTEPNPE